MHFVHSLNEGGIERLLFELCRKINRELFEIQICCIREKGILYRDFENIGIKIHYLNAEKELTFGNIYRNAFKLIQLRKILINEDIDITHGHEFFSTVFSRLSAVISGIRIRFITLHNMYLWWSKKVHFVQKILSYITTRIICNSASTMKFSLEHDKISRSKYSLIYNGIDTDKFKRKQFDKTSLLKEFGFKESDYICLSVGNISIRKGFEYMIRVMSKLNIEYDKLKYLIVGGEHHEENDEFKKIMNLITEYKLNEVVKITGRRNDVEKFLNVCDLYVMPSVTEGFGLALTEAMSMENIVLVSDIEPFREIVSDGNNGYYFKSCDCDSLSEKLRMILNLDEIEKSRIKRNARNTVMEKFNLDTMVKNYELLYKSKNNI